MSRFSIYVALTISLFLQMTVLKQIRIMNSSPDLVFILVIFFGLFLGSSAGMESGLFAGLAKDIFALDFFGINIFILASAGFLAGVINTKVFKDSRMTQLIVVFSFSVSFLIIHFALAGFLAKGSVLNLFEYCSSSVLAGSLYTGLLALPVFSKLSSIYGLRDREDLI